MFVEERGYKGHVELCISSHNIGGSYKLSAAEAIGLFEQTLSSLCQILLLETYRETNTTVDMCPSVHIILSACSSHRFEPSDKTQKCYQLTYRPVISISIRGTSSLLPSGAICSSRWKYALESCIKRKNKNVYSIPLNHITLSIQITQCLTLHNDFRRNIFFDILNDGWSVAHGPRTVTAGISGITGALCYLNISRKV